MSSRNLFTFAEKIVGLVLALVGAALTYYTFVNREAAGMSANFFIGAGIILAIVGVFLVIARTS